MTLNPAGKLDFTNLDKKTSFSVLSTWRWTFTGVCPFLSLLLSPRCEIKDLWAWLIGAQPHSFISLKRSLHYKNNTGVERFYCAVSLFTTLSWWYKKKDLTSKQFSLNRTNCNTLHLQREFTDCSMGWVIQQRTASVKCVKIWAAVASDLHGVLCT